MAMFFINQTYNTALWRTLITIDNCLSLLFLSSELHDVPLPATSEEDADFAKEMDAGKFHLSL